MSTRSLRPLALSAAALAVFVAGCSSNPFARDGRFFQYHTNTNAVVAEYMTADAATCQKHLANMKQRNTHATEAVRCSVDSAAASLPVSAAVTDPATRTTYNFRFASMEHCQRMLPALVAGPAVTASSCRR